MPSPDYILTVVFGPDSAHGSPYLDLGAIKPYVKPTVKKKKKTWVLLWIVTLNWINRLIQ